MSSSCASAAVSTARHGAGLVATIHNPVVNAIGVEVRRGLLQAVDLAQTAPEFRALLLVGTGGSVIAGADTREFSQLPHAPSVPEVCNALDGCVKPVIAAPHGPAVTDGLGGCVGGVGEKTGGGHYLYLRGARAGTQDPGVLAIVQAERQRTGVQRRHFTAEEIMRRYTAAIAKGGANVLREGIAIRPPDIDVISLHGCSFPRYRGGLTKYAETACWLTSVNSPRKTRCSDSAHCCWRSWSRKKRLSTASTRAETPSSLRARQHLAV